MDEKKDIYKLWLQYTAKNDESYFRQFIIGFNKIWKSQLILDFENFPKPNEIESNGPKLNYLPDELLPAITKFIIIARDQIEQGEEFPAKKLLEIADLIECLIIISRQFDNIETIIKYEYLANLIAISTKIFEKISDANAVSSEEEIIFLKFSRLLEVIYDPYFTWRNFLKGIFANYNRLKYKCHSVNVEIIPFIYDCFQNTKIFNFPSIGASLVNALASIISGSQKILTTYGGGGNLTNDNLRNGMIGICPATVSIVMKIITKWECSSDLRIVCLKCCALMIIVLQRSSPEERQIELVTIIKQYCDCLLNLLKIDHFTLNTSDIPFEIDDSNSAPVDICTLQSTILNIETFLSDNNSRLYIANSIIETNLIDLIISIPYEIRNWNINQHEIFFCIICVFNNLTKSSKTTVEYLRNGDKFNKIFDGLRLAERPSQKNLEKCFELAFDNRKLLLPEVIIHLIKWLPDISDKKDQIFLSELLFKGCADNFLTKTVACEYEVIKTCAEILVNFEKLTEECVQNLIKLIEELGKINISPIEFNKLLWLLREQTQFPQSKKLFQSMVTIALKNSNNDNKFTEYLIIQNPEDGLIVPDIKNWNISGSFGFIFHCFLRLDPPLEDSACNSERKNYRRMLFRLITNSETGYEIFIQNNNHLVVATITRKEYLTSSINAKSLFDNNWHFVTVSITPPKRPFSYSQINIYIDFLQKLSTTLKVQGVNELFTLCTIGSSFQGSFKMTQPQKKQDDRITKSTSHDSTASKGIFPSFLERTLSTNVSNYFTLPLRSTTASSFDPNVKNFPIGMQDTVFGEPICLKGQIVSVLLADPITNLKTIFDNGTNFPSSFSQDNDQLDLSAKFIFCYTAASYANNCCSDLVPGGKFNATVIAEYCKTVKLQDTINRIGGLQVILPIFFNLTKNNEFDLISDIDITRKNSTTDNDLRTPTKLEEFHDWEMVTSTNSYTEWKMIQHPIASFFCFLRFLTHDHETNQENLITSNILPIIASMLFKCDSKIFDVNCLMSIHLFVESMQNQKSNNKLLEILHIEIVFNFEIWSKMQFQITLGHIQYINTMIKNDRKYFRKNFGIQFFLDVIRNYYLTPNNITDDDAKTIRITILSIIRYYLQKDVNIKEIGSIIAFIASVKNENILIELMEMLMTYLKGKYCKDQMFLLLHEPHTANLLYNLFIDKIYSKKLQEYAIRFLDCLLTTTKIQGKYKQILKLQESDGLSMFPGFFSYLPSPLNLSPIVLTMLIERILLAEIDFSGFLFLVHQMSLNSITEKLEIAKKLFQITFSKSNSPEMIAKQIGWQESIARLFIRKTISMRPDDLRRKSLGINVNDVLLEDNTEFLAQSDLINFCEESIEQELQNANKDTIILLDEIQASVSEAAIVIENEIKELAGSVTDVVAENVGNIFSVIRQRTSEIQESFETLAMGASNEFDSISGRTRTSSNSSDDQSSLQSVPTLSKTKRAGSSEDNEPLPEADEIDMEEQLVYVVTNILFTVLWRGISNDNPSCWKQRGQVLACINLLALNNELITSHLTLKLKILEMGVQAALVDLSEHGNRTLTNQENAYQLLRIIYDLVVLGSKEDDSKKCSTKLLDGVLALFDCLMVFQQSASDDWSDMTRLCFGLLLKCSHSPSPGIVAMATAKLHGILQSRNSEEPTEMAYLLYSINKALDEAIEVGNPEHYSFLMPLMKALLEKCNYTFNLETNLPDLPPTSSGPVFFNEFQMYSTSKKWKNFMEKLIKPLYDNYQKEVEITLWEPINRFWAECYEACKLASKKRGNLQAENRRLFQQKVVLPWKLKQVEEMSRLKTIASQMQRQKKQTKRQWKSSKRFLYGPRGPWCTGEPKEEFWILSKHENVARMRLKLEPELYPDKHESAASLRDNAAYVNETRPISSEFNTTIKSAVVGDFLTEDENNLLEEEIKLNLESHNQDIPLEKAIIIQECELITLMSKVKGKIEVNQSVFTFTDISSEKNNCEKHDFRFSINRIREVHLRKYNLRRSALEIFLIDQTSYFLNFTTKTRNRVFTKILSLQPPNILYGSGRSPAELFKSSGLTQKWVNREISNFEYLMYLNTIAGRSYNDLSQYPIFPWILADYTSEVLDLSDHRSFRDLSKPVGVVNKKNEAEVRAKYESFEDPSGMIPKFHYGTHYSNSAGVLHYLLRVEPFTSLHIELQSGRFDVADRQFHSIPQTWKLLMDNPNDVKELIPEFFYFPEFLKNMNKFDLGHLQITKEKVNDVILPKWANTPEQFIEIHRRALESEFVSKNLHQWIDLIFGFKQKGPKAVEALNVFYYCSYEGAVDLDKITNPIEREAVEGMINNFGQIPSQLTREPHPRRLTLDETINKLLKLELRKPDLTQFLDRVIQINCELSSSKDPIIFISVPRSPPKSFLQLSPDVLVSVSKSSILGCNSWMGFDKEKGFLLEVDATTANIKNRKRIFGPFHPSISIHSQLFAVSIDGKFLYVGGIWDNSLRVFNVSKGKLISSVSHHSDLITCLALDNCGSYLVTGSKDFTCVVWSLSSNDFDYSNHSNTHNNISHSPKHFKTLYGHDGPINSVAVYTELDLVVSGSQDGTVNIYSIQDGQFIRTLYPSGCSEIGVEITFVTVSYQGHIGFSALDDTSHSVHVFNINGTTLGSKYVSGRVTGLTTISDYLVVADDAGDVTVSRLNGLKPVFDIPLHIPIQTIVATNDNTHLLAPLRDGRLAVVCVAIPTYKTKHSILNV